jgi:hypothetical protein
MAKRTAIEMVRVDAFARFDAARFDAADHLDACSLERLVVLTVMGCLVASMPISALLL